MKDSDQREREIVKKDLSNVTTKDIIRICKKLGLDENNIIHRKIARLYKVRLGALLTAHEIMRNNASSIVDGILFLQEHDQLALNELFG